MEIITVVIALDGLAIVLALLVIASRIGKK